MDSALNIDFKALGVELIQPVLRFAEGEAWLRKGLKDLARLIGAPAGLVGPALEKAKAAQAAFEARCRAKGREVLEGLGPKGMAMVFVTRPYNGLDAGLNLGLHRKLRDLGVLALPMDFLDLDSVSDMDGLERMYWRYGQKILAAAKLIKEDPRLHAVYVTNFACGPDSFILHFFRDYMQGRPYLEIEIDEHSADVGAMTRLEAFLDSIKNVPLADLTTSPPPRAQRLLKRRDDRTIFIPNMTDHAYPVAAAFRACGVPAEVMPESNQETLQLGRRFTSGKECYPCILTTGDMVKMINHNGHDREKIAFFMPSGTGPCRFGNYYRLQRLVLDELGYPDVPIYSPQQTETLYEDLGQLSEAAGQFTRLGWEAIVAVDLLQKKLFETRPYETNPGQTDQVYGRALERLCQAVSRRQDLAEVLAEAGSWFEAVPTRGVGSRPLVGVVGEIYTRTNRFANENVIRQLEELGAEVSVAPFSEWILYVNHTSKWAARRRRLWKQLFGLVLTDRVQHKIERRLSQSLEGHLRRLHEPPIPLTLARSQPYIDPSYEGEACLSVGKVVDFLHQGASGVVNVIPFTCMPGTIVHAVMKRFREEHDNVPYLSMACDGQEQTNLRSRLEAFMYQVGQFQDRQGQRRTGQ